MKRGEFLKKLTGAIVGTAIAPEVLFKDELQKDQNEELSKEAIEAIKEMLLNAMRLDIQRMFWFGESTPTGELARVNYKSLIGE